MGVYTLILLRFQAMYEMCLDMVGCAVSRRFPFLNMLKLSTSAGKKTDISRPLKDNTSPIALRCNYLRFGQGYASYVIATDGTTAKDRCKLNVINWLLVLTADRWTSNL